MVENNQPYTKERIVKILYTQADEIMRHMFAANGPGWFEGDTRATLKIIKEIWSSQTEELTPEFIGKLRELEERLSEFDFDKYNSLESEKYKMDYIEQQGLEYAIIFKNLLKYDYDESRLKEVLKPVFRETTKVESKIVKDGKTINGEVWIPKNLIL